MIRLIPGPRYIDGSSPPLVVVGDLIPIVMSLEKYKELMKTLDPWNRGRWRDELKAKLEEATESMEAHEHR